MTCMLIQWGTLHQGKNGEPACPQCGKPAELVMGMIGPCWAHKTKSRKKRAPR